MYIVGEPGVGKTQLWCVYCDEHVLLSSISCKLVDICNMYLSPVYSMQLALDVQISNIFGGVNGDAIYIDTEGSLNPVRMREMAKHVKQHIKLAAKVIIICSIVSDT